MEINDNLRKKILIAQRNEMTEHIIYGRISDRIYNEHNKRILERISEDELRHYKIWKSLTGKDVPPYRFKLFFYLLIIRILGLTFGLRLMEKGEKKAQISYRELYRIVPSAKRIINDESIHEKKMIGLLHEEKLRYIGSIVLGLNDAIVELTGVFVGLTLVLQNTRLIAVTGLVTGVAASMSMAASEYLSIRSEQSSKNPLKSSFYTGLAYITTVLILAIPYLIFSNAYLSLVLMMADAILIILIFTYYISIARELPFMKRFTEMLFISLGVSALTFVIAFAAKKLFLLEV